MSVTVTPTIKVPLRKLKQVRLKHKVTQKMIAERLGCTVQFYSQMERGINVLNYSNALKIAIYFETTPDELFRDDFERAFAIQKRFAH